MPQANDVGLTFDPNGFTAGVKKAKDSMISLTMGVGEGAVSISKRVSSMTAGIFGGIVALGKKAMQFIPEIGSTWDIAKDMFFRNFFQPLRKELVPLLQWFLNWTRDNRATFVLWGSVVANFFRIVVAIGKELFTVVSKLVNAMWESIRNTFFKGANDITEALNVAMLKLAVIFEFLRPILDKVATGLGSLFSSLTGAAKDLMLGFGKTFDPTLLDAAASAIQRLGASLQTFANTEWVKNLLDFLGKLAGAISNTVLVVFIVLVDTIGLLIEELGQVGTLMSALGQKDFGKMASTAEAMKQTFGAYTAKSGKLLSTVPGMFGDLFMSDAEKKAKAGYVGETYQATGTYQEPIVQPKPSRMWQIDKGATTTTSIGTINIYASSIEEARKFYDEEVSRLSKAGR